MFSLVQIGVLLVGTHGSAFSILGGVICGYNLCGCSYFRGGEDLKGSLDHIFILACNQDIDLYEQVTWAKGL